LILERRPRQNLNTYKRTVGICFKSNAKKVKIDFKKI
jgi:hypothetical protein